MMTNEEQEISNQAPAAPPPAEGPPPAEQQAAPAGDDRPAPPEGGDRPVASERPAPPEGGDRPAPGERRRRHFGRRRVCSFCVDKASAIDYKDPAKLRRYLSDRARIEPRRKTGTCAKHQRWLATALKRARHLALLPYAPEHIRVTGVFASRR
jgi:small subunit ribosomal protein S18